ncbi:MAG: putative glycolipid-binding domain-containing protein [Acidimicrobiia bacterium]|jgi:hypothetical protein
MSSGEVIWYSPLLRSMEYFRYREHDQGHLLSGTVVLPRRGFPATIRYEIAVDAEWETVGAAVHYSGSDEERRIDVEVGNRVWWIDGKEQTDLTGCIDIDLGWTPATNTLAIRRAKLAVGARAEIQAAWLRFPELEFRRAEQTYSRQGESAWTYEAGEFKAELTTGPLGIVVEYGPDVWATVASRFDE